jgi:hypothetical protein
LFVFKQGREKSFSTSDFMKGIAKIVANGGNNAKIQWDRSQPSLFWGENGGKKYQTWNLG